MHKVRAFVFLHHGASVRDPMYSHEHPPDTSTAVATVIDSHEYTTRKLHIDDQSTHALIDQFMRLTIFSHDITNFVTFDCLLSIGCVSLLIAAHDKPIMG